MSWYTTAVALALPKVVDSVGDFISEAWDECFDGVPKFSLEDIARIKQCRKDLDVTDEHLAYQLNEQLNVSLKVEDYRKIW